MSHDPTVIITTERLERAADAMAYIVTRHGRMYLPLFEMVEHELEMRAKADAAMARAQGRAARLAHPLIR